MIRSRKRDLVAQKFEITLLLPAALRILLGVEQHKDRWDLSFCCGVMAASVSATPEWWFREKRNAIPKVELSVYYNACVRYLFVYVYYHVIIRHAHPHGCVARWCLALCRGMEEPFLSS